MRKSIANGRALVMKMARGEPLEKAMTELGLSVIQASLAVGRKGAPEIRRAWLRLCRMQMRLMMASHGALVVQQLGAVLRDEKAAAAVKVQAATALMGLARREGTRRKVAEVSEETDGGMEEMIAMLRGTKERSDERRRMRESAGMVEGAAGTGGSSAPAGAEGSG